MSQLDQIVPKPKNLKAKKAKIELKKFIVTINKQLDKHFEKKIDEAFGVSKNEKKLTRSIWKHIKEHNLRPAKRLRASFVYYGYKLLTRKPISNKILTPAMGIELIHTALLIHDDFMDNDEIRRGKDTTHKFFSKYHKQKKMKNLADHYGASMAINAGDIALLEGYDLIARSKFDSKLKIKALQKTFVGIQNTAFGQAFDISLEALGKGSKKDVIDLHHAKTAIYTYKNPLHIGAIFGGATENELEVLTKYAIPAGIAFQLQDDILGMFGDSTKTGKSDYSDIRQGKVTLLFAHALEKAKEKDRKKLLSIWGNPKITRSEANEARRIIKETSSLQHSKKVSIRYAKKAQKAIAKMQELGWDREAIDYLDGIAYYMIEREI